jgi:hypothetical protein
MIPPGLVRERAYCKVRQGAAALQLPPSAPVPETHVSGAENEKSKRPCQRPHGGLLLFWWKGDRALKAASCQVIVILVLKLHPKDLSLLDISSQALRAAGLELIPA